MIRAVCLALVLPGAVYGQLRFEVASIKPSLAVSTNSSGLATRNGRLTAANVTLKRCIMGAFAVGPNQIVGGPGWLDSDRYNITAKAEQPTDSDAEIMEMVKSLMVERFKLAFHREIRTMQAYVLEASKKGPRLGNFSTAEASTRSGRGSIDAKAITMTRLAEVLSRQMELPVVNDTGLDGAYDVKVEWNPEPGRPTKIDSEPSIFTAIQEQLGLRLTSRKAPVAVFVIDHAEKPTEN